MYKKSGEHLPPSVRRLQGIIRHAALSAALLAAPVLAQSQNTVERWRLVVSPVPEARTLHTAIQQQLQQSLHQPVDMYFDNAQPPQPLQGVASQPLIVLLSEFNSFAVGKAPNSLQHLDNLTPLQVFFEMPWCLYVQDNSPLLQQSNVKDWMTQQRLQRPVRIGISARGGQSMFWLYVLSQATHSNGQSPHNIVPVEYRGAHNQEQVWRNDADMALAPCWQSTTLGQQVRLLATAQAPTRSDQPSAQTFTDLRLPPLAPSWFAAFVPKSTAPAIQAQAIAALEKAATAPAVLQAIEAAHHQPLRWSHAQSRKYIENYITTWQSVMQLLQWNAADAAITPVAARYAQAH